MKKWWIVVIVVVVVVAVALILYFTLRTNVVRPTTVEEGVTPAARVPKEEVDAGALSGKIVSVFGAFVDQEEARFNAAIKPFEDRTGIDVQYEASKEFETLIVVRVEGGNPPDIAALPQPGLMKNFAERGALVPLWPEIKTIINKNYAPVWLDLGSHEGKAYGVFHRVNMKSLVWYPRRLGLMPV